MCWHQEYSHPSIELSTFQISSYRTWDTSLLLLNSLGFIYIPADFNLFDVLHEIYILTILHTNCHYNFANGCGVVLRYLTVCVWSICVCASTRHLGQVNCVASISGRVRKGGLSKFAVRLKCPCTLPNLHRTPLEKHPLAIMPGYLFVSRTHTVAKENGTHSMNIAIICYLLASFSEIYLDINNSSNSNRQLWRFADIYTQDLNLFVNIIKY